MSRAGKSKLLTMCTTCDEEVGVWATTFNRNEWTAAVKVAAHGKPRCPGSLLAISPNVTWPNPKVSAA